MSRERSVDCRGWDGVRATEHCDIWQSVCLPACLSVCTRGVLGALGFGAGKGVEERVHMLYCTGPPAML